MTRKKLAGDWYTRIQAEQVQPGDWVEFFRQGYRVRQVQDVHFGRKHKYIRFKPSAVPVFKNRTLKFEEILGVWRRDDPGDMQRGAHRGEGPTQVVGGAGPHAAAGNEPAEAVQRAALRE